MDMFYGNRSVYYATQRERKAYAYSDMKNSTGQ